VALAAAGELDGGAGAITRATAAANALISDSQSFGQGGRTLAGGAGGVAADFTLTFHSALPTSDQSAMASLTTDPADAIFVRVVVNQHTVDMPFADLVAMATGNSAIAASVSAEAVAGFTMYACDVTPMMFCLPSADYNADEHIGDQILMRSGGSGSGAWQPGNFGFLDLSDAGIDELGPCDGLSGQNLSRCLLGAEGFLSKCFSQRGIDTKPGQNVGSYEAALNVRFDMYEATMNGARNDVDYRPAPNVIKGVVPNNGQCIGNNPVDAPSEHLPQDACFATGSCPDGARFGDGDWESDTYVAANHGTDPTTGAPLYPAGTNATSTRYSMYLAEIARANGVTPSSHASEFAAATNGFLGTPTPVFDGPAYDQFLNLLRQTDSNGDILGGAESGRPTCSNRRSPDPERRVIILAGVDCTENPISGAANNVPVEEFFKVFLTQPAGADPADSSHFNVWGEVIGSAGGPGSSGEAGTFRDVVQLYR
jgi:hypothetical protein